MEKFFENNTIAKASQSAEKEPKNEKEIAEKIKNFQGDFEAFLKFCGCYFVLSETANEEAKKELFKKVVATNLSSEIIKSFLDKITKRYEVSILGAKNCGEKEEEYADPEEMINSLKKLFDGLLKYDKNQEAVKKILKLYPSYTLGDEQSLVITDSLKEFLENNSSAIDRDAQLEMIINLWANKTINTKTFEMHEDDFWDFHDIVFSGRENKFDDYLKKETGNKDSIEILKEITFCKDRIVQMLKYGKSRNDFESEFNYLDKRAQDENYFIAKKAEICLSIVKSANASYYRGKNLKENCFDVSLDNNLVGKYSLQGELKFSYPKNQIPNGYNTISNEDLIRRFFERQKDLGKEYDPKVFDENYLFFSFSDLNIRESLEKDFGIKMEELSLYEQKQFLYFIKDLKTANFKEFSEFLGKDLSEEERLSKIKSFLVLEQNSNLGEKITRIGNTLKPEDANTVFKKIAELSDFASKETEELGKLFYVDEKESGISRSRLKLLNRAQEIIINFSNAIEHSENKKNEIKKLLSDLDKTKIEIELLHSVLKSAKENNENIPFEMIRDLEIETKEIGEDLSEEDKNKILGIARKNYFECIYKDNPELAQSVISELKKELETENISKQNKYILRYKGEIIAFCRFKPIERSKTDVYAGSLNIYDEMQTLRIGKYFAQKAFNEELKKYENIHGICRASLFEMYKNMGFAINKKVENEGKFEKYGVPYLNIVLSKKEASLSN